MEQNICYLYGLLTYLSIMDIICVAFVFRLATALFNDQTDLEIKGNIHISSQISTEECLEVMITRDEL